MNLSNEHTLEYNLEKTFFVNLHNFWDWRYEEQNTEEEHHFQLETVYQSDHRLSRIYTICVCVCVCETLVLLQLFLSPVIRVFSPGIRECIQEQIYSERVWPLTSGECQRGV